MFPELALLLLRLFVTEPTLLLCWLVVELLLQVLLLLLVLILLWLAELLETTADLDEDVWPRD